MRESLKALARKRVPIIGWASDYNADKFFSDLIAGVTVGLTVMPQALAYATLAGLEPQYGLYSAFAGCFIYAIFGSIKDITIGPTALMALMTYQQIQNRNSDYAILLCFLSGVVQILMAVLNLGVLIDFISIPVTVGFTSATSVIIAASQLKGLLGLKISASGFLDTITKVFQNIHQTRAADAILSLICIIVLILLRKLKDVKVMPENKKPTDQQKVLAKTLWLISMSRNALVVLVCSLIAYLYENSSSESIFVLTGKVKGGLPELKPPPFSTEMNNRTVNFVEMVTDLGASVVMVPVIAVLGNVAIAKAFASGKAVDATQELITLSLCNIFGSFFSSMPITGSFSRSAVNNASGVRTPIGGFYTGILVLLALSFLTPYFAFIPKASLAAVIICAVIYMIEFEVIKPMWRSNRNDLIPMFATFFLCLFVGVELGIVIGIGINMLLLIKSEARPDISIETLKTPNSMEYLLIHPKTGVHFPGAEHLKKTIEKQVPIDAFTPIVLDFKHIMDVDYTAAKVLSSMFAEFDKRKQYIYLYNVGEKVAAILDGICPDEFSHINSLEDLDRLRDNVFAERCRLLPLMEVNCKNVELKEITCDFDRVNLNHRKKDDV